MEAALSDLKNLTRVQLDVAPLATDGSYASVMNPCIAILQAEAYAYHQDYVAKSPELYQKPTLERILAGAKVSTPTYIQSGARWSSFAAPCHGDWMVWIC